MQIREPSFSEGMRSVFVWASFGIRSRFVGDACLPACLPACMQAGSRYSYQYGTSYHKYSYISRTRGRSYGTVDAAMRPRCGDPPNKVCTAVGKLDVYTSTVLVRVLVVTTRTRKSRHRAYVFSGVTPSSHLYGYCHGYPTVRVCLGYRQGS